MTFLGGIIGPQTVKLIGRYWPFAAILALFIALLLTRNTLSETKRERDKANHSLGTERANHAVTRQSVATLEGIIAAKNEEARRRAAEFEAAKVDAAKDLAAADARFAATEAKRAYLARLAAQTPGKPCPVPDGLLSALEGL